MKYLKFVMVGESATGKTALLYRYNDDIFDTYLPTTTLISCITK